MSLWDSLTGRKSSSSALSSPTASSASEFVAESDFSSASPSSGEAAAFATPSQPSSLPLPAFLNDPSLLHPLSGLSTDRLDYLKLEDTPLSPENQHAHGKTALPQRGFSDDLCYGTGCTYLAALSLGGALGLTEGLRRLPPGASSKLRLNAILNGVTRRGPFLGNSAGVIALGYNCVNYSVGYLAGSTPLAKSDTARNTISGGLTGMIFKSTRGTRPMLISGGLVASAAAIWTVGKDYIL